MRPTRDLARLEERLAALAAVLDWPDDRLYLRVASVSAWSPAQHADHLLRTLDVVFDRVGLLEEGTDPEVRSEGGPILVARLMLATGWIPRGRGDAPTSVLPDPRPVRYRLRESAGSILRRVDELRARASALATVRGRLPHPLLGSFGVLHWIRFADLHTKHHLAILADVDRHRGIGVPAPESLPDDSTEGLEVGAEPS